MRIKGAVVFAFVLLILGVVGIRSKFEARPVLAAEAKSEDVLIFTCGSSGLFSNEGSSGAPSVTATTCSQGLADALKAGFKIQSANLTGYPPITVYTLVRAEN